MDFGHREPEPLEALAVADQGHGTGCAALLREVRACTLCAVHLPHAPRPVLQLDPRARLLITGQAPGRRVHETGIPFNDSSGDRLRAWLGIPPATFYDTTRVALVPMGLCYPGRGRSGDLPPRRECAATWRPRLLACLPNVALTLAVGRYAVAWHCPGEPGPLAACVARWRARDASLWALPHPSPRNQLWLRRNPWFESELLPALRARVAALLHA